MSSSNGTAQDEVVRHLSPGERRPAPRLIGRLLPRPLAAVLQLFGTVVTRLLAESRRRSEARALYMTLHRLDTGTLRDLGFDRSELHSVVAELTGDAEPTRVRVIRPLRGKPR
jgi:hypothetical protein